MAVVARTTCSTSSRVSMLFFNVKAAVSEYKEATLLCLPGAITYTCTIGTMNVTFDRSSRPAGAAS